MTTSETGTSFPNAPLKKVNKNLVSSFTSKIIIKNSIGNSICKEAQLFMETNFRKDSRKLPGSLT